MSTQPESASLLVRDLGDGLVLRRASRADAGALAEFNARIHSDNGPDSPDERIAAWTHDLAWLPHPTFQPGDFTLVEDTHTGKIISSLNLISQTWSYAGIEFGVGRPELVGTLPEYRHRGLVRAQFEVIHQWSAERGELVQGITGIPFYYRLFGYEMAMNLSGGRTGFKIHLPKLKEGEAEPYAIRPAAEADLAFIAELTCLGDRRYLVSCVRDEALWRYELSGKTEKNVNRFELRVITTPQGEPVGFLAHPPYSWTQNMAVTAYELKPGISWAAVTPSVARYLWQTGEGLSLQEGTRDQFGAFSFWLGAEHPAYRVLHERLPRVRQPYAWYLRVPDLPAFLRRIRPVLEARLAASPFTGHTGELQITFYNRGLHLAFENGRLIKIEPWKPVPVGHSGQAAFPGLTFLQLLFGYRSLSELVYEFPDCSAETDIFGLLDALFPKQVSDLWPVS